MRLVNSGTEATLSAVRLARGFTGRPKVVKFAGCYHGHVDSLLATPAPGRPRSACPPPRGSPGHRGRHDRVALQRRRRRARLLFVRARRPDRLRDQRGLQRGTWASSRPLDGLQSAPRRITAEHGALLILDEVMTGFRVSRSGWYGLDPVDADLFTFGNGMGGGLPVRPPSVGAPT